MRTGLILIFTAACSGAQNTDRDAVLVDWLQRDNAPWTSREASLIEGKFARMAGDPYDFMRGTAGLFYEDQNRRAQARIHTDLLTTRSAATVLIVGDPHPENLGTFLGIEGVGPNGWSERPPLELGWTDMDASTYGPWLVDVRRAAQGLSLFVGAMEGCEEACRADAIEAFANGYVDALNANDPSPVVPASTLASSAFIQDLVEEAGDEGASRKRWVKNSQPEEGGRALKLVEAPNEAGEGLVFPTDDERALFDRIFEQYNRESGSNVRLLDVGRRFGQGVSSRPALRFVAMVDRGDDTSDDDQLLNVREILDPPPMPVPTSPMWTDNAQRVTEATAQVWSRSDLDPLAGAVALPNNAFKVLTWDSWYQGLDHLKASKVWRRGDGDETDIASMATGIGAALAQAHARSYTPAGDSGADVIQRDLNGQVDLFIDELVNITAQEHERTLDDHQRFIELLDTLGPTLQMGHYSQWTQ
ncbi:MAG: DUF2252 family protein [Myxococcota bacterium]